MRPHRLYNWLEDWNSNAATGRSDTERTTFAGGIVVAEPDSNGDVVGEAHEPRIVLIIRRAGLPGNKRCKVSDGVRGATRQDALHHALELIEGSAVDRPDHGERFRIVQIHDKTITFNRFDNIWNRAQAFIRDRRIECREINRPHRLGAEDERIIVYAIPIDLRLQSEIAEAGETFFGFVFNTAVRRCTVARLREFSSARRKVMTPPEFLS